MERKTEMARDWRIVLQAAGLALLFLTGIQAEAQTSDPTPQRGFQPAGSYALSEIETINTVNGDLLLSIPIAALPPGRAGLTPALNLLYNSKLYDVSWDYSQAGPTGPLLTSNLVRSENGGWKYGYGYRFDLEERPKPTGNWPCDSDITHKKIFKLKLSFPDGSQHLLRPFGYTDFLEDGYYEVLPDGQKFDPCNPSVPPFTGTMAYYTTDGTYVRAEFLHDADNDWLNNPWTIYFKDGRRVTGGNAPQRIYDANGNYVDILNFTWNGHPATELNDQQDRHILIEFGCTTNQDCIYAPAAGAWEIIWRVNWGTAFVSSKTYRCTKDGNPCLLYQAHPVITAIQLPSEAGALNYAFGYAGNGPANGYGELNSMTLPSGASASYAYQWDGVDGLQWQQVLDNYPTRKELALTETYDGASALRTEIWTYSISFTASTVTTPDGGVTSSFYNVRDSAFANSEPGLVYKIELPGGSVVERIWAENIPFGADVGATNNPVVKTEFRSLKDLQGNLALTSAKEFSYDKNGNVTRVAEYDWMLPSVIGRDGNGKPISFSPSSTAKRVSLYTYYNATPDSSNTTTDNPNVYHKATSPRRRMPLLRPRNSPMTS